MSRFTFSTRQLNIFSIQRWLPHNTVIVPNALFHYELRRMIDSETLRSRSKRWFVWGCIGPILFWLVHLLYLRTKNEPWQQEIDYLWFWQYLALLFWASLADKLILDFTAVITGLRGSRSFTRVNWDLILISLLNSAKVINAKHAVNQIRIWRMMMVSIGFRAGIFVAFNLQLFITPHLTMIQSADFSYYNIEELVTLSLVGIAYMLLAVGYIIEPYWRIKTLTAGSVAVSTQPLSSTFQILSGLGVVVGFFIMQVASAGFLFFVGWILTDRANIFSGFSPIGFGLFSILWIVFMLWFIRTSYHRLGKMWLSNAYNRMMRGDGNQ